ncbi:hypothetical protein B0H10DRAFT_1951162 [Mycena sp. CBHHK59/15]|nr:hypothetical protein B0H10DRAFT_1951162 [Mycena sp. CBHHK59/15]
MHLWLLLFKSGSLLAKLLAVTPVSVLGNPSQLTNSQEESVNSCPEQNPKTSSIQGTLTTVDTSYSSGNPRVLYLARLRKGRETYAYEDSDSEGYPEDALGSNIDRNPVGAEPPPCILRPIVMIGALGVEQVLTCLDADSNIFALMFLLPYYHPANPDFRQEYEAAFEMAIAERASAAGIPRDEVRRLITFEDRADIDASGYSRTRTRHGMLDTGPKLFPGPVYHEHLATTDPSDDTDEAPGARVRILALQVPPAPLVEDLSSIQRCEPSNMACLAAMLNVGPTQAYMLFDSGSNTDSITPEYAHATGTPRFKLAEQVVLQLGCVGSRYKISYGTRAPIDFGGICGHLYLD